MNYRTIGIALIVVAAMALASGACLAQDAMKQIKDGGITVSYPPKMESQAKKVLEIAKKSIQPSIDIHGGLVSLLADPAALATEITDILGAEEATDATKTRLLAYKHKSEMLIACFSNIKLIETSSAIATGGVDAGALQVRYSPDNDEFKMAMDLENTDESSAKLSYFPVFINADGAIRAESKLADMALDFLGSSRAMIPVPIHEAIVYVLSEKLNLYYPFSRWFNEGVSGWVTKRIVTKNDQRLGPLVDELFTPGATAKKMRDNVNFISWPQSAFQNRGPDGVDARMEVAQTQYAVEAIGEIVGGNRNKTLAKIISAIKHDPAADLETICRAATKVAGTDCTKIVMNYVPKDIRFGIDSGEPKRLVAQAEKLALEKKYTEAEAKLRRSLEMAPADVNARLNLAWLDRELGARLDSEIQVFTAARLLKQEDYKFHLFATSVEGNYVLGRLSILLGNLEYAKKFLEPVLEANPNHPDAKKAMDEIRTIEAAAKGS